VILTSRFTIATFLPTVAVLAIASFLTIVQQHHAGCWPDSKTSLSSSSSSSLSSLSAAAPVHRLYHYHPGFRHPHLKKFILVLIYLIIYLL